jgi:hypothetical protein
MCGQPTAEHVDSQPVGTQQLWPISNARIPKSNSDILGATPRANKLAAFAVFTFGGEFAGVQVVLLDAATAQSRRRMPGALVTGADDDVDVPSLCTACILDTVCVFAN